MDKKISSEKVAAIKAEYEKSTDKNKKSFKEYLKDKAASDTSFVPWLYDFEQHEDFSNGLTRVPHDAFDAWIDTFDNY